MKFFFLFETAQSKTRSMAFSLANKQAFSSRVNFAWKIEYVCNYVSKTTSSPSLLELNFFSSRCSLCHVTCSFFVLRSSTCDSGKSENAQQKKWHWYTASAYKNRSVGDLSAKVIYVFSARVQLKKNACSVAKLKYSENRKVNGRTEVSEFQLCFR